MGKRFTSTDKWNDPWFRKLPTSKKLFWQYILDNCNSAGIWNVDLELASYMIGESLDLKKIKGLFKGRIEFLNSDYWFVPKFPEFQYGRLSDDCRPHQKVIDMLKRFGLWERVSKGYPKGIHTLQDKEEDKESLSLKSLREAEATEEPSGPTPESLVRLWNERAHPNLPRVTILTDKRKTHIKARLLEHPEKKFWEDLVESVNSSPLLRGENNCDWKCTFDWILNVNNMAKIIEGNYDGTQRKYQPNPQVA